MIGRDSPDNRIPRIQEEEIRGMIILATSQRHQEGFPRIQEGMMQEEEEEEAEVEIRRDQKEGKELPRTATLTELEDIGTYTKQHLDEQANGI